MSVISSGELSTTTSIKHFNEDLLNRKHDKFWTGEVLATASTGEFWEDDPSEKIKRRVNELFRIFHQGRGLQVKNLPRDVTEEEIRDLLSDFPVQSVKIVAGASGCVAARVTLEDPEMLEEWDHDKVFFLRNQRMPVAPERTEMVLCVARLPLDYTEEKFRSLLSPYGDISMIFLMISEKTGLSKGYGFVKYTSKDAALKAKDKLNGMTLNTCVLCCDWLDVNHVTFASLHSKCLYVDQLPPDFYDMGEFRKVFSTVVNPPYCQIALKNGCPQNWGLVEFNKADDAENTQASLSNFKLKGHLVRISYYIPGVRALTLYLTLLNDSDNKEKSALLPDPPGPAVFLQFQSLAMRNPVFAQNLQNIILQSSQKRNDMLDTQKKSYNVGSNHLRADNRFSDVKGSLLGGPGGLEHIQGVNVGDQIPFLGSSQHILGQNPQMLAIMQSLLNQNLPSQNGLPLPLFHENMMRPPLLTNTWVGNALQQDSDACQTSDLGLSEINPDLLNPLSSQKAISRKVSQKLEHGQKPPLLNFPPNSSPTEELTLNNIFPKPSNRACGPEAITMNLQGSQFVNNSASLISGILNQLQSQAQFNLPELEISKHAEKNGIFNQDMGLLENPDNVKTVHFPRKTAYHPNPKLPPRALNNPLLPSPCLFNGVFDSLSDAVPSDKSEARGRGGSLLPTPILGRAIQSNPPLSPSPFLGPPNKNSLSAIHGPQPDSLFQTPPRRGHPINSLLNNGWLQDSIPALPLHQGALGIHNLTPSTSRARPLAANSYRWSNIIPGLGNLVGINPNAANSPPSISNARAPTGFQHPGFWSPPNAPSIKDLPGGRDVPWTSPHGQSLLGSPPPYSMTPIGQKRKYDRILPSPEPSPEGNYIGQHSQGIGGHYADSYFKRKKN